MKPYRRVGKRRGEEGKEVLGPRRSLTDDTLDDFPVSTLFTFNCGSTFYYIVEAATTIAPPTAINLFSPLFIFFVCVLFEGGFPRGGYLYFICMAVIFVIMLLLYVVQNRKKSNNVEFKFSLFP